MPAANAPSGPRTVYTATNYIDKNNLQFYLDANAAYTKTPPRNAGPRGFTG